MLTVDKDGDCFLVLVNQLPRPFPQALLVLAFAVHTYKTADWDVFEVRVAWPVPHVASVVNQLGFSVLAEVNHSLLEGFRSLDGCRCRCVVPYDPWVSAEDTKSRNDSIWASRVVAGFYRHLEKRVSVDALSLKLLFEDLVGSPEWFVSSFNLSD